MSGATWLRRRSMLGLAGAALAAPALQSARAAVADAPSELRIGFQKGSLNLALLKSLALLDKHLPGTPVQWVEFPAGPQLLEALAVGSVDLGATGDSPPVFAQAAGKALWYVGAEPPKPDSSAILVKPEAPLQTLAHLKGRRIALQKGSSAHFLTVQAVAKAGLGWADITPVYLPPADARAAFERGSVDAWAIWDPYYAAAEIDGRVRVLATSRGSQAPGRPQPDAPPRGAGVAKGGDPGAPYLSGNNTFYLAAPGLAARPATLAAVFAALTETDAWVQAHREQAAKRYAQFAGLGLATVLRVLQRRQPSPVGPMSAALVAEQQRVADAFHRLGLIPQPIRVAQAVWQPTGARVATR
jgi:sulfonate transport system substrate-binding protein